MCPRAGHRVRIPRAPTGDERATPDSATHLHVGHHLRDPLGAKLLRVRLRFRLPARWRRGVQHVRQPVVGAGWGAGGGALMRVLNKGAALFLGNGTHLGFAPRAHSACRQFGCSRGIFVRHTCGAAAFRRRRCWQCPALPCHPLARAGPAVQVGRGSPAHAHVQTACKLAHGLVQPRLAHVAPWAARGANGWEGVCDALMVAGVVGRRPGRAIRWARITMGWDSARMGSCQCSAGRAPPARAGGGVDA